ncbi:MAG TPA: nucleotide exchange factor GrpE [Iamia sp.]|nr:nucleotide exchange factor GrpE [Iamia sp.]
MTTPTPGPDEGPDPDERIGDEPGLAPARPPDGPARSTDDDGGPGAREVHPFTRDDVPDDLSGLDDLPPAEGGPVPPSDLSVEALLDDVERLTIERDGYLDRWQRATADFENSKRRLQRDAEDAAARATGRLAEDLLPVLDACDAAIAHGEAGVEPVFAALLQTLEKNGLERIDPTGDVFDPNRHEAVMHEPAGPDDDPALALVSEVLRIGYAWKGRVVRAAMVKVRG